MPGRPRKTAVPNPFYVFLIVVSTAFVVTALGYLVGPTIEKLALENPKGGPGPSSRALADWLDRRGSVALGIEFVVMLVSGVLAMLVDRSTTSQPRKGPSDSSPEAQP